MSIVDKSGRKIDYMRLSVTDLCNMRCRYCMPESGVKKLSQKDVLSYEQMLMLVEHAVAIGIRKVRITGGEPLVRKGIVDFLAELAGTPGLQELVLTTNGLLLEEMAADLKMAGVQRLNISLDSLQPETFAHIARRGTLDKVVAGIDAAEKAGLPVKVNMVVMRGVNDAELIDFAALSLEKPYSVRFIEYMPVIKDENWQQLVLSGDEILARLSERYEFHPIVSGHRSGPSRDYKIAGARGKIGVITPLTGHFCEDCNRIRISASGKVKNCLFADGEYDLKPILNSGEPGRIRKALADLIQNKPASHQMTATTSAHAPFSMSQIGG